jgi:hypothetical protein
MTGKFAFISLAFLTLAACGASQQTAETPSAAPVAGCDRSATQVIAFTAPDAQDLIETRSFGPDCGNAVVMILVRRADGAPLYAWSTAKPWPSDRAGGPVNGESMQNFLQQWGMVSVDTTMALPDWPQRQQAFTEQLGAFMSTPFVREEYLDIRRKALPRLCFATGIESGTCIYYDAQANSAAKVLDTGS